MLLDVPEILYNKRIKKIITAISITSPAPVKQFLVVVCMSGGYSVSHRNCTSLSAEEDNRK